MGRDSIKPEWFPLPIHEEPPLTFAHWIRAIVLRLAILNAPQSDEWKEEKYKSVVLPDTGVDWEEPEPSESFGIHELTPYEAFVIAGFFEKIDALSEQKELAKERLSGRGSYTDEAKRIKRAQLGHHEIENWFDEFMYRIPVMVDLALDDASLKSHFEFWLEQQRRFAKDMDLDVSGRALRNETFSKWHAYRVLAAFDLISWRSISKATYSDAAIASWLWPDNGNLADNSFVDRAERLRKVTKPLIESVMNFYMVERLSREWGWELLAKKIAAKAE